MIQVLEFTDNVCDVCRLLEGDTQLKGCVYCDMCDSWICHEDMNRWGRRARAWLRRRLEPLYKGVPDGRELYKGNPEADSILRGEQSSLQ